PFILSGKYDEACRVVCLVLDVLGQHLEAVNLGRELRRERAARDVARLGDMPRRARGIGRDHGLVAVLADEAPALAERVDMALDRFDGLEARALRRHQVEMDR